MASQGEENKRSRGRPRGKTDAETVTFKLPPDHFAYLTHLVVVKKRLGNSPNDAARHILIRELDAMLKDEYHKRGFHED